MIEGTENNFEDRPSIYEVEQVAWSGGKGERCVLLIEAFSISEAVKLSGGDDGVHETIGVRQVGSVCLPKNPQKAPRFIYGDECGLTHFLNTENLLSTQSYVKTLNFPFNINTLS